MGRHIFLCAIMAIMAVVNSVAQSPLTLRYRPSVAPDSADVAYYGKRDFKQAALTVVGLNMGVWVYDRYVQNADFAHISWDSFKENLSHGLIWDNDLLSTNMFLHPYHGNLYFNSARSNGFNYWQSGLFAFAGSAMWEFLMEQEYPSTNDIIATPIGGMAIGEVAFRASDMLIKDNTRGWERFGHEAAVFLVSPMREITRIINGDAWRYRPTTGRLFGKPNISADLSVGARWLRRQNKRSDNNFGFVTEFNLEYGDRYELRSSSPYDYFKLHVNLAVQRSQPVISQLNITGRLISREIVDTENNDASIGLYQHYDFYDSDTISFHEGAKTPYRLAVPASAGVGMLYKGVDFGGWAVDAFSHVNAVFLGGILTDHYNVNDRNYNLASGFSVKTGATFIYKNDLLSLSAGYDYYRMFTWGYPRDTKIEEEDPRTLNAEGDASVAYFGIAKARVSYRIMPRVYLTGAFSHYMRSTRYRDFDNVKSSTFSTRLMLTYKF